ncbi:hypothetical protein KPY62_05240 [Psychrobacter sp. TAE2020]|uniref:hypothetical protein n=1 Tax=Psychrobacter sp. TAE2020 TaxID=2846762 RepID=UPI001C1232A9|nr:hypothetical protein [Psychrobacter sp. TAE2020]MBU5616517.1 hypothetical protein [Psychrobacter sp. TAE2020]
MNIHDLSEYQLYKLKSIDPTLSSDWLEVIRDILPKLNKEGQISVYKNILKPRGIYIEADRKPIFNRPNTLALTIKNVQTKNKNLVSIALHMAKIIDPQVTQYNAIELADKIEAILGYLDNLEVNDLLQDQKNRQKIRVAFLYDLALWIDNISLDIDAGIRNIDVDLVKSYFKEVFIKQQIQGRDFRNWDSSDLSFQETSYLPPFIKQQGTERKFLIVEGQHYWYLIGTANKMENNPYSFRRFLYEDRSGSSNNYIYLTHIVLKKDSMHNSDYLAHASYCMSRLYTLDRGVSDNLLKFMQQIQQLYQNYLRPLLKKPLQPDGSDPELIIKDRMIEYERQLSILILQKLPNIIQKTSNDLNDQDYLFYHLDRLMKQMSENIQDFRLQPLSMYSASSEIMLVKLITLRRLLNKSRDLFYDGQLRLDDDCQVMGKSLLTVKQQLDETEVSMEKLQLFKNEIDKHYYLQENGSFWQKIKLGKAPEYSLAEIDQMKLSIHEDLFISIVRLAKTEKSSMVYTEFECNEIINENYRHYALADGKLGISTLPRILRLNEDRSKFSIKLIREALYEDIFKSGQQWSTNF